MTEFFSFLQPGSWKLDLVAFFAGICVGSFLNVLALRSLSEESILWPASHCPRCKHPLAPWDNIPLISWLMLGGKCRYCRGPISWQYPVVEAFTGFTFVAIERIFFDLEHSPFNTRWWNEAVLANFIPWVHNFLGNPPDSVQGLWKITVSDNSPWSTLLHVSVAPGDQLFLAAGALFLACTLIAVTITDFREKLIPHDITYPAMLIGIFYSATVRHDLLGAMAGIGASYILFDFIAFYGLKVYLATNAGSEPSRRRRLKRRLPPRRRRRLPRALRWRLDLATIESTQEEEPIEVMGGGDAVLSAVMSAFLGWQLLVVSLIFGFVIGTAMGLTLLVGEMQKANLLHKGARMAALGALIGATIFGGIGMFIDHLGANSTGGPPAALVLGVFGAIGGALLGLVSIGTRVSKPYPFGPALAAGGFIAIFLLPNWHYLNSIAPTQH